MTSRFKPALRRAAALLLLLAVLSGCAAAGADPLDMEALLARNAITQFDVKNENGETPEVRRLEGTAGRGQAIGDGEPDYTGVLGYAALAESESNATFSTFSHTPWELPCFLKKGKRWKLDSVILHKTPVVVIGQMLLSTKETKYGGYLHVIRLDTNEMTWLNVNSFVTVPYWTYAPEETTYYGNCVAVYRNTSRREPMDPKARSGALPDGTRILLCDREHERFPSPDTVFHPLTGIVFHGEEEEMGTFLFFNPEDLTIVY